MTAAPCSPRMLPLERLPAVLRRSAELFGDAAADPALLVPTGGRRLALVKALRWPRAGVVLTVQFLDGARPALRSRILLHMNAWGEHANVRFEETVGVGLVRITRDTRPPNGPGHWSYVGRQILGVPEDEPTMNLEGFTMKTPEGEFRRVVRHEAGHTLGFDHEHLRQDLVARIDRSRAYEFYERTQGWTRKETRDQVLTPLARASLMGTLESDPLSIMCYEIPADITKDGVAIPGGVDIHPRDHAFAAQVYPKTGLAPKLPSARPAGPPAGPASKQVVAPPAVVQAPSTGSRAVRPAGPARAPDDALHIVVLDNFESDTGAVAAPGDGPRYARIFASFGGARVTAPMQLRRLDKSAPPTRWRDVIRVHERIKAYTNEGRGRLPDDAQLLQFGTLLFEILFHGDVRRLYDEARARCTGRRLDLVFTSMIPWIAEKPWEFAYDTTRGSFLATEDIHFVRNVLTAVPADVLPAGRLPLRLLVAAAQPVALGQLSADQEAALIRRGFDALIEAGLVEVEILTRATPDALHAALATGSFDVAHVIAHGVFDPDTDRAVLMFEDGQGNGYPLGERQVRDIFCGRGLQLVFLNACQSGSGGHADFNKGLAQSLVAHGLPALVANQYSVLDNSATAFAQRFYWGLAHGLGVGAAAREARIGVNYQLQGEAIDWAVPVVYARDPGLVLCPAGPRDGPAAALRAARGTSSAGARGRALHVAVWDIDNVLPSLDDVLQRMNGAQARFGFELTDLSAPLELWDASEAAPDGGPYLRADWLARRLARAPQQLRVQLLVCVTRRWMRDEASGPLLVCWPAAGGPAVAAVSLAGLAGLQAEGLHTDRALASSVVLALAGHLAQASGDAAAQAWPRGAGADPPPPLFADPAQALRLQPAGLAALQAAIPGELPTIQSLLQAFD